MESNISLKIFSIISKKWDHSISKRLLSVPPEQWENKALPAIIGTRMRETKEPDQSAMLRINHWDQQGKEHDFLRKH